jgi:hypothetical protein
MSSAPQRFKRTEIRRAVRSAEEAGLAVQRVEISDGKIVIIAGKPDKAAQDDLKSLL